MKNDGAWRRAALSAEPAAAALALKDPGPRLRAGPAPKDPGPRLRAALASATRRLAKAGCETPRLDAELLAAEVLGWDRARLVLDAEELLDGEARARFELLLARRAAREPVAYILGRRAFRRLTLAVDQRVLIPRPESELLVEVGLSLPCGWRVADIGTGSGAIALALKDERPDLSVCGIDVSAGALAVARANARRLGLEVRFARADLLDDEPYDAVLANLPYVEDGAQLAPEIARYEPPQALFAGADGLAVIRRLCSRLASAAAPAAAPGTRSARVRLAALEHGSEQAPAVAALLRGAGFQRVRTLRDLAGRERVTVGER